METRFPLILLQYQTSEMAIVVVFGSIAGVTVVATSVAVDRMPESAANVAVIFVSETGSKQGDVFSMSYL